ncbi:Uncharacterised protein [Serratia fonticola]|nr:Uncharacterised protein [Serratia fonticola]
MVVTRYLLSEHTTILTNYSHLFSAYFQIYITLMNNINMLQYSHSDETGYSVPVSFYPTQ